MTLIEYSEYKKLKDQVLLSTNNSERYSQLLSTLKEFFHDDINSPRRYEQITAVGQLLRILEIRDVLSADKVGPLKEIARRLPNSFDLLQKINAYESSHIQTPEFVQYYGKENIQTSTTQKPVQQQTSFTNHPSNPNTGMSIHKKKRIIETIIEDIGINWKDLARGLNIKEKVIDDLNENHKEVSLKARCILDIYNEKADDNNWFFDLCDALETCRRRELIRKLKKIIVMNI